MAMQLAPGERQVCEQHWSTSLTADVHLRADDQITDNDVERWAASCSKWSPSKVSCSPPIMVTIDSSSACYGELLSSPLMITCCRSSFIRTCDLASHELKAWNPIDWLRMPQCIGVLCYWLSVCSSLGDDSVKCGLRIADWRRLWKIKPYCVVVGSDSSDAGW